MRRVQGVTARGARIERIDAGGFHAMDINAAIMPDADFAPVRSLIPEIHGILGIAVFSRVLLDLDFPSGVVAVERRGYRDLDDQPGVDYRGTIPLVALAIGESQVPAILDTGSNFSLILRDDLNLPLGYPWVEEDGFGGAGLGSRAVERGANAQIDGVARLGPVSLVNPFVRRQVAGTRESIGTEAISRFRMAIDARARRIAFLNEPLVFHYPESRPADPARRPGAWLGIEGDAIRLQEVDAGGSSIRRGFGKETLLPTSVAKLRRCDSGWGCWRCSRRAADSG
jgi:hypothetical protein